MAFMPSPASLTNMSKSMRRYVKDVRGKTKRMFDCRRAPGLDQRGPRAAPPPATSALTPDRASGPIPPEQATGEKDGKAMRPGQVREHQSAGTSPKK